MHEAGWTPVRTAIVLLVAIALTTSTIVTPALAAPNAEGRLLELLEAEEIADAEDIAMALMDSGHIAMITDSVLQENELGRQLASHVTVNYQTGVIDFDKDAAIDDGVDQVHAAEVAKSYAAVNVEAMQDTQNCEGSEGYHFTWRHNWNLNSCTVNGIVGLLEMGAGAAAIAALFPGPHSAALLVAAALIVAGAGWLGYLNRHGCGSTISYPPIWGKSECA